MNIPSLNKLAEGGVMITLTITQGPYHPVKKVDHEVPNVITRLLPPELEVTEAYRALTGSTYYTVTDKKTGKSFDLRDSDHLLKGGSLVANFKLTLLQNGYRYRDVKTNELYLTDRNWKKRELDKRPFKSKYGFTKIKEK